jgi:hypothetical protein
MALLDKLTSFLTTRCPVCRHREGRRIRRSLPEDRFLSLLAIYPFECGPCNHRFRAILKVRPDMRLPLFLLLTLLAAVASADPGDLPADQAAPSAVLETAQLAVQDQQGWCALFVV